MNHAPPPTIRQVVSGRAEDWIDGSLDSAAYFSVARRDVHEAARREIVGCLQRMTWWNGAALPSRYRS